MITEQRKNEIIQYTKSISSKEDLDEFVNEFNKEEEILFILNAENIMNGIKLDVIKKNFKILLKLPLEKIKYFLERIYIDFDDKELIKDFEFVLQNLPPTEFESSHINSAIAKLQNLDLIKKFNIKLNIDNIIKLKKKYDFNELIKYYVNSGNTLEDIKHNFTLEQQEEIIKKEIEQNLVTHIPELTDSIKELLSKYYINTDSPTYTLNLLIRNELEQFNDEVKIKFISSNLEYIERLPENLLELFVEKNKKSPTVLQYLLNHQDINKYPNILEMAFKAWIGRKRSPYLHRVIYIPDNVISNLTLNQVEQLMLKIQPKDKISLNIDVLLPKILALIAQKKLGNDILNKLFYFKYNIKQFIYETITHHSIDTRDEFIKCIEKINEIPNKDVRHVLYELVHSTYVYYDIDDAIRNLDKKQVEILEQYLKNKKEGNKI